MSYPELYSDERVVLKAQNVKVKSVVFEVVLTTRRLVLIDTKKNSIPPQEINLATLKDVESGENAIRDPTITISIITISGNTRQMVLTFSRMSGGERRREAEEWVRALRQHITSTIYHPVTQAPSAREQAPEPQPPAAQPPAAVQPAPAVPPRIEIPSTPPQKKRIEIARPVKKITDIPPAMPAPVETSSLPVGSFCNRCGSRVPPDSAFCNRCGTPVAHDSGAADIPPVPPVPQSPQAPVVPQVQVSPSPIFPTISEKKERPIEQVIHSIEPLIEDSVPRTTTAPVVHPRQAPSVPDQVPLPAVEWEGPAVAETPAGEVRWPVLTPSATPLSGEPVTPQPSEAVTPPAPPVTSPGVPPVMVSPPPSPPPGKSPVKWIAVIAIVILAVVGGVFLLMQNQPATPPVTATPTPPITAPETTLPPTTVTTVITTAIPVTTQQAATPQYQVPASGVFVKVTTTSKYSGQLGTPGRLRDVSGSGDQFFQISTINGPVAVNLQKNDASSALFSIDVYKDGKLMKHVESTAPNRLFEFQTSIVDETMATTTTATAAP